MKKKQPHAPSSGSQCLCSNDALCLALPSPRQVRRRKKFRGS